MLIFKELTPDGPLRMSPCGRKSYSRKDLLHNTPLSSKRAPCNGYGAGASRPSQGRLFYRLPNRKTLARPHNRYNRCDQTRTVSNWARILPSGVRRPRLQPGQRSLVASQLVGDAKFDGQNGQVRHCRGRAS